MSFLNAYCASLLLVLCWVYICMLRSVISDVSRAGPKADCKMQKCEPLWALDLSLGSQGMVK